MSRVNGLAQLPGCILLSVHMGNFSSVDRDGIQETQPKWLNMTIAFAAVVALWTLKVLLMKLILIVVMWKCIRDKNDPIAATMLRK